MVIFFLISQNRKICVSKSAKIIKITKILIIRCVLGLEIWIFAHDKVKYWTFSPNLQFFHFRLLFYNFQVEFIDIPRWKVKKFGKFSLFSPRFFEFKINLWKMPQAEHIKPYMIQKLQRKGFLIKASVDCSACGIFSKFILKKVYNFFFLFKMSIFAVEILI